MAVFAPRVECRHFADEATAARAGLQDIRQRRHAAVAGEQAYSHELSIRNSVSPPIYAGLIARPCYPHCKAAYCGACGHPRSGRIGYRCPRRRKPGKVICSNRDTTRGGGFGLWRLCRCDRKVRGLAQILQRRTARRRNWQQRSIMPMKSGERHPPITQSGSRKTLPSGGPGLGADQNQSRARTCGFQRQHRHFRYSLVATHNSIGARPMANADRLDFPIAKRHVRK